MTAFIYSEIIDVEPPQHHEFTVGEPKRDIWADNQAEEKRRAKLAEVRHKVKRLAEARRKQALKTINVEASFYIAMCAEGCTGRTATGIDVNKTQFYKGRRIIAVDPSLIPLGTTGVLTLANGQSFAVVAQDTGGAIVGNKIDVLVASEGEAKQLGRQMGKLVIDN